MNEKDAICTCAYCGKEMTWAAYRAHIAECRRKHGGDDGLWWDVALIIAVLLPLLGLLSMSCGSPAGPPAPVDNTETLRWVQEPLYADNTPLDLRRNISWYEIHLSDNAVWGDNTLRAALAGVDDAGVPVSTFDLALLAAYGIGPGDNGCYVTVRSISSDNISSGYGIPCWWEGIR